MIPPTLRKACDLVLQFNFVWALNAAKYNKEADFLLWLEAGPNEKITLKIQDDILNKPLNVKKESTGNSPEEQVFNTNDDQIQTPEPDTKHCKTFAITHQLNHWQRRSLSTITLTTQKTINQRLSTLLQTLNKINRVRLWHYSSEVWTKSPAYLLMTKCF